MVEFQEPGGLDGIATRTADVVALMQRLGRGHVTITFAQVEAACEQKIEETDQLDWKRDLPTPTGSGRPQEELHRMTLELAKDIAAMANGRGGILVYGVEEDGQNRADTLIGTEDLNDGVVVKRIHQTAYNYVHPPAQIDCLRLTDGKKQILVVVVPESDDGPHLVRPKKGGTEGWYIAPYRSGADTHNMVEKQLEAAYRERSDGRRRRNRDLIELHEELRRRHVGVPDRASGAVVAVAQPIRPRLGPLPGRDPDRTAFDIVGTAAALAESMAGELKVPLATFPALLLRESARPRRSLRRYVFSAERQLKSDERKPLGHAAKVLVELHDDGSIGLLWRRGGAYRFTKQVDRAPATPGLAKSDMDAVGVLLLSLMQAIAEELGYSTEYQLRVTVEPDEPLHLIPEDGWAGDDYPIVPPPPPLEIDVRFADGADAKAADFLSLARDLNSMVEESRTMLEAFWELPKSTRPEHPVRQLALRLFAGEPTHPAHGKPMC